MHTAPDPGSIFQLAMGFMVSKTLLSAVELELFTVLAVEPQTAAQLDARLGLNPRGTADFLDTLVSLGLLSRTGNGGDAVYSNGPDTDVFLDKNKPSYMGGMLEMLNHRLFGFWGGLTTALRTGEPQNEAATGDADLFDTLYSDPARLDEFLRAMAGIQAGNHMVLAQKFDFSRFTTLCDAGGANGALSVHIARSHPHMRCTSFDLPVVQPLAERYIAAAGVADRVSAVAGSFFDDALPNADIITMGNILHDWNEEQKKLLFKRAFEALPSGGAFIAIEMVIDDDRRMNTMGMLMSLNMLIETRGGFDYTGAQFDGWARAAGFARTEVISLAGPTSAAIAWKA